LADFRADPGGMTRMYRRIPDLSFPLVEFPSAGR
jgi:hypothetical protein